ncbi:chlorohydrolase [Streptococcus pneumoniae]|uniref:chlorohydrolase n=1 Tax=Streptococcus pneumoniae TaxID=1313 RepID=UPI00214D1983|nr:chlorohydrolase [Streptococcus pneumoniae]
MKIKEQTKKLAAGCSKHCFEVADGSKHCFEVVDKLDKSVTEVVDKTDEVSHIYNPRRR